MRTLLLLVTSFIISVATGQQNFKWEKIDSVNKTKSQIYADTKMYIAGTWIGASTNTSSAATATMIITGAGQPNQNQPAEKHTIQNDDKENGVILVSGELELNSFFMMNWHKYKYSYTVQFLMKDGKYKLVLDNVHCTYAHCGNYDWPLIEPCEEGNMPKYGKTGVPEDKLIDLMFSLRSSLQTIATNYETHIEKPSIAASEW